MNGTQPTPAALERACSEIYTRWRRFVPEAEAREQEQIFRGRCQAIRETSLLEVPEFDAMLAVIGDAMAAA